MKNSLRDLKHGESVEVDGELYTSSFDLLLHGDEFPDRCSADPALEENHNPDYPVDRPGYEDDISEETSLVPTTANYTK
ncbi:hypothetical protein [Candidatus Nanohalococcus occultus]|uniref:hypothetical protein n=1 Tax=Candidatus Nanohalococcus occultus TaxID=2978047 RepID=UPI0039E0D2D3